MKSVSILKIALAVVSIACVFDMPYGYYQLYRFIALGAFVYLAYAEHDNKEWMTVWIISALLVQPFFKVALGRDVWNIVDILWAILLLISAFKKVKSNE
jgi:hypothetical protein